MIWPRVAAIARPARQRVFGRRSGDLARLNRQHERAKSLTRELCLVEGAVAEFAGQFVDRPSGPRHPGAAPLPTASSNRSPVGRSAVKRSTSFSASPYLEGQVAKRSANSGSRTRASARYSTRLFFGGRVLALAAFRAGGGCGQLASWPATSLAG